MRSPEDYRWSSFRAWAVGEVGIVEIENEWTASRRNKSAVSESPTLAPEKRRKGGMQKFSLILQL